MKFEEKTTDIIKRIHDVKSFRFRRPEGFEYKPGQYILVSLTVEGKVVTKAFSLSSSPTEKGHIEFTKKLTGHPFSNVLDNMNIGDSAVISGPFGNMTFEGEYAKVALLSGGIGITPMVSICRYCTDMHLDADIMLIYSNKTENDLAFREELDEMMHNNSNLKVVYTLTRASESWTGCRERICENMVAREIPDYRERHFLICGPPEMVRSMEEMLIAMKIPKDMVKKEALAGY
ncbi:flavodoxin reductase family protein [Methanomethylovorans hollandica DSM 15978]|uniref:Flavodoxin reductase family protein n=1 Tax=Methanomethylovorans hollandica (strain DSM 15978 / NBRC 107637 / DMS1) TaxID=867904 RepID=L0L0E9_METHD|nr:FAD-binding oxidoreductase [Methanomethylovorans hollandica]AGB50415.1 flavodoxin reductase family protein [Methanomethylovorans hollandica DSM 15978]